MISKFLDFDPFSGITQTFHYNPATDETTIETTQDVTQFLEKNVALQNNTDYTKDGIKREWFHYASIPLGLAHKWMVEKGMNFYEVTHDTKKLFSLLNDPDYRKLKVTDKYHAPKR